MAEVTMLETYRRRKAPKLPGTPTISIDAWADSDGQVVGGTLMLEDRSQIETQDGARDTAFRAFKAAQFTAQIISEQDNSGAWAAEPVFSAVLVRGGYMTSTPNLFWHNEAHTGLRHRISCAWWVLTSAANIAWPMLRDSFRLLFMPGRLRALDIDRPQV